MVRCSACGSEVAVGAGKCNECGLQFAATISCKRRVVNAAKIGAFLALFGFLLVSYYRRLGRNRLSSMRGTAQDWVSYWASAHELVQHRNPYDSRSVGSLEISHGFSQEYSPLMVRNPPNAFFLMAPIGYLPAYIASIVWRLLLLACLIASIQLIRGMLGQNPWLNLAYCFTWAFACIAMGQSSLFVLVGITLFIRLHPQCPLLAGVALSLCAMKPHLLLPFGVVFSLPGQYHGGHIP